MPFSYRAKVQRQPICPARSSPADGEKNLHRRIFLFQVGTAILNIRAVVFISPNLAGQGCRREYRHDKNTAYSGSLDASDKTNILPVNHTDDLPISLWFGRELSLSFNISIVLTIYFTNNRTFDMSNYRTFESYLLQYSLI